MLLLCKCGTLALLDAYKAVAPSLYADNGNVCIEFILVVVCRIEKEAAFHSLLNEPAAQQLLQTCIFVTGKGLSKV